MNNYNNQGYNGYGEDGSGDYGFDPSMQQYGYGQQPQYMTDEEYTAMYYGYPQYQDGGYAPSSAGGSVHPPPPPQMEHAISESDASIQVPHTSLDRAASTPGSFSSETTSKSYLPSGAMPSHGGVLSSKAAEFWFPECRECTCCNGFKHGCKCCTGGLTSCSCATSASGGNENPPPPPQMEHAISESDASIQVPHTSLERAASTPGSFSSETTSKAYLPSGAMPSHGGVLSSKAAEFWFPECRECTCCNGFKHGCKCCTGGLTSCSCAGGTGHSGFENAGGVTPHAASAKQKPCMYFLSGSCMFGDRCKNAH